MAEHTIEDRQSQALSVIGKLIEKASYLMIEDRHDCAHEARVRRWQTDAARALTKSVNDEESIGFLGHEIDVDYYSEAMLPGEYLLWAAGYLQALYESIESDPEYYFADRPKILLPQAPDAYGDTVYIMHGSDITPALELKSMIEQYGENAGLIREDSSGAKTLIEMLEAAGQKTCFVIVVLTPDDDVTDSSGKSYKQPRPNALLELGFYLGLLGRNRVIIVCKEGLRDNIPSDIGGIRFAEYRKEVTEVGHKLQIELKEIGRGPLADKETGSGK
jgi:predicted nucleotide-binding protein